MKSEDVILQKALRDEQQTMDGTAPDFAVVWEAAERQARSGIKFAVPAALALIAVVAVSLPPFADDPHYVDEDELLGSTSWTAPSDALLPDHQFDIFREIPRLIESTELL